MKIIDGNKHAESYFALTKDIWHGAETLNLLPPDTEFIIRFTIPHKIKIDGVMKPVDLGGEVAECSFWAFNSYKGQPILYDGVKIVDSAPIDGWHVIGELALDGYVCGAYYFCDKLGRVYFAENAKTGLNLIYDPNDPQTKDESYTALATILFHVCCLIIYERNIKKV